MITIMHYDGASMRIPREWTDVDGVLDDDVSDRICIYTNDSLRHLFLLVDSILKR